MLFRLKSTRFAALTLLATVAVSGQQKVPVSGDWRAQEKQPCLTILRGWLRGKENSQCKKWASNARSCCRLSCTSAASVLTHDLRTIGRIFRCLQPTDMGQPLDTRPLMPVFIGMLPRSTGEHR